MNREKALTRALGGVAPRCGMCGKLVDAGEAMLEATAGIVVCYCRECAIKRDPKNAILLDEAKFKAERIRGLH